MNAQNLWAGTDYAWKEYRRKGVGYEDGAKRVKVIRIFKERQIGNTRDSTFAKVYLLNDDGTFKTYRYDSTHHKTGDNIIQDVRARDIMMHWGEYENERDHRIAEAEQIEQERQAEARKAQEETQAIKDSLISKGLPPQAIISIRSGMISISVNQAREWLGVVNANV